MKKFLIAILFLFPQITFAAGTIQLKEISTSANESIYSIEAIGITDPIVGISATLNLAPNVKFQKFDTGTFFEQAGKENSKYLISSKANDPSKVLLGIVSLGSKQVVGNGTIAKLYFTKSTANKNILTSITDTVVSGIAKNERHDYTGFQWQINKSPLPSSGPSLIISGIIGCLLVGVMVFLRYSK